MNMHNNFCVCFYFSNWTYIIFIEVFFNTSMNIFVLMTILDGVQLDG